MKKAVILGLICSFLVLGGNAGSVEPTIITGDDIRRSGIMRPADIFLLFDDWAVVSLDGCTWSASPLGLSTTYNQQWIFMINDIPIDIDLLGSRNIERFPFTLAEIDYIELYSGPVFRSGICADAGLMNIHLKEPEEGLSLSIEASAGNETGDPGPFRHTEYGSPNVDRLGQSTGGYGGFGRKNWYLAVSGRTAEGYYTDPVVLPRIFPFIYDTYFEQEYSGGSWRWGLPIGEAEISALGAVSRLNDFFFDFRRGNEMPSTPRLAAGAANSRISISRKLTLLVRSTYSLNRLEKWGDIAYFPEFDWEQRGLNSNADLVYDRGDLKLIFGGGWRYYKVKTGYALTDDDISLVSLHGNATASLLPNITSELTGEVAAGDNTGYKLFLSNSITLGPRAHLSVDLGQTKKYPEESNYYWLWRERGYQNPMVDTIPAVSSRLGGERRRTVDINFRVGFGYGTFKAAWYFRNFRTLNGDHLEYETSAFGTPFIRSYNSTGRTMAGDLWGFWLSLESAIADNLRAGVYYRQQKIMGHDIQFKQSFHNQPERFARFSLTFILADDFSVRISSTMQSKTSWPEYANPANLRPEIYVTEVDGFCSTDLAVQKYFWGKRISWSLFLRNIFDDRVTYHANGVVYDLTYYALFEFSPF